MKKALLLVLLCINTAVAWTQPTYNITGIVIGEDDRSIPGATVFLADSRQATASNNEGKFVISQLHPGKYTLVVKIIGYAAANHEFTLQDKDARFRIKLEVDNIELKTVNISALSLAERKKHLATFIRCFFGISANAAECKILNTDAIVFNYDKVKRILKARSSDFLVIENRALGYRIKYLLNDFVYDTSGEEALISFNGTLFYEELNGNARQHKQWDKARAEAYLGSSQHFFRSVYHNTLKQDGFVTFNMLTKTAQDYRNKKKIPIHISYYKPVEFSEKFVTKVSDNIKTLQMGRLNTDSTELWVVYTAATEPGEFLTGGTVVPAVKWLPNGQKTVVRPVFDEVTINKNGEVSPVGGMVFVGFWMWGKMAWALPSDYELPGELYPSKEGIITQHPEKN